MIEYILGFIASVFYFVSHCIIQCDDCVNNSTYTGDETIQVFSDVYSDSMGPGSMITETRFIVAVWE